MKLCSACLMGIRCCYDGKARPHKGIIRLSGKEALIPVCPEQLGGLSTPREPSERRGDRVLTKSGRDVTENFKRGSEEALKIAKIFGVKEAIFKEKSPACGSGQIYDGIFSDKIVAGDGTATELLRREGIKVISCS